MGSKTNSKKEPVSKVTSKSKKITTEKKSEKSSEKSSKLLVFVLIAIVILALVTIIFWKNIFVPKEPELDRVYNGYIFEKSPPFNLWNVTVKTASGELPLEFYYHPQELEEFTYDDNITKGLLVVRKLKGKVFIGYDSNFSTAGIVAVAGSEIARTTGKMFGLQTKSGFIEYIGDNNIPIVNCSLANSTNFVFEIKLGNENKVEYDKYCAIIYAKSPEDTVKMADFIVYNLILIMPDKTVKQ